MSKVKQAIRWLFTHEPAILSGIVFGIGIYFALRYGTKANGAVQGLSGSTVALAFGFLRNFVTSPAGRKAIDIAQADVAQLPQLASDLGTLRNALWPALQHPSGILGLIEDHSKELKTAAADVVDRVHGMLRASQTPVTVNPAVGQTSGPQTVVITTPAEPVAAAPVADAASPAPEPAPDALADLGKLVGT